MSSIDLLDKTRKIGKFLFHNNKSKVAFNDICKIMKETTRSDVLVISRKGKVLGKAVQKSADVLLPEEVGTFLTGELKERLEAVLSTKENVNLETLGFDRETAQKYHSLIVPTVITGERVGTLFLYREGEEYSIEDIILCEYGSTVVGLEMLRSLKEEASEEQRKDQEIAAAFSTLSHSEKQAILQIFDELEGNEGILIASRIAEKIGITRSVIVNALRKFESAGIIESRSSGMRGTYIKVLNDHVYEEIENLKNHG